MPQPNKIPLAFAASGDKNTIPENTETTGLASWREGFPAITSVPFSEGGIAPKRADFNGIFNALSAVALWYQQGGVYAYDNATDYEVGNVVFYSGDLYKCLSANGPSSAVKAPTDTTVWAKVILTIATTSAAGYMSATDKQIVDALGTVTWGTLTRTLDTTEVDTNSWVCKIGNVGFLMLSDNFPSVSATNTFYKLFKSTLNSKFTSPTMGIQVFDSSGRSIAPLWFNSSGEVYIRTRSVTPTSGMLYGFCAFPVAI